MRAAILIAAACVLLVGCPKERKARDISRKVVEFTAEVTVAVDQQAAIFTRDAVTAALAECETRVCYDNKMAPYRKLDRAIALSYISLKGLDTALDAWEAGVPSGPEDFRRAAGCMLRSLELVREGFASVGKDVPALTTAIEIGRNTLGFGPGAVLCEVTP